MAGEQKTRIYRGVAVAQGYAVGKVKIVDISHFPSRVPRQDVPEEDVEGELERLRGACSKAKEQIQELAAQVEQEVSTREADLLRPQAMMVEDPAFIAEIEEMIVEEQVNAEAAVAEVMQRFEQIMESLEDEYLRERSSDVHDAGRRIIANLLFVDGELTPRVDEPRVIVSSHLVPSLTVHLERENVLAFATEKGGFTSHAAILARSLGIPAVTGLSGITEDVVNGQTILVDGMEGTAVARPSPQRVRRYREKMEHFQTVRDRLKEHVEEPAVTGDGEAVSVMANIGRPPDIEAATEYGAEGVGLYRTEFDYLGQSTLPEEKELVERYTKAVKAFPEQGVSLRVLDIGGDKFPPSVPLAHEDNPFIGLRGLRLLLERMEGLLLPQLRAMIRASAHGKTCILYPMVASVEDLERAREIFERARREVREEGHSVRDDIQQGTMIEVPSCVPMLPELLERSDFATVGTNDLVQYVLAADRNSERMVEAYDPFNPAVIRLLDQICRAGRERGMDISVCGEVAANITYIPLLIGLGFRTLSVNPQAIPYVRQAVREVSGAECEALAADALHAPTTERVRDLVREFVNYN